MARVHVLIRPNAGAVVMASAIVSDALRFDGREDLSRALVAIAAVAWVVLSGVLLVHALAALKQPGREPHEPGALTEVAATGLLATRLATLHWWPAAAALGIVAALAFAALAPAVVRELPRRTVGGHFLLTVSTLSLAVVAAVLAPWAEAAWLLAVALGLVALGIALYVVVVARFDVAQLRVGRGDQWILGGALAIAVYALAMTRLGAQQMGVLTGAEGALEAADVVLWATALAMLPPLLFSEVRWPRPGYDVRRWATVFPLGMYAQASFALAQAGGPGAIGTFASWWAWVAFAAWVVAAAALVARIAKLIRRLRVERLT